MNNTTQQQKVTYKKALEMARRVTKTEAEAQEFVKINWIDTGLVGDPNNRKSASWKFEGTNATFYKPSSKPRTPKKYEKVGEGSSKITAEMKIVEKLLDAGYQSVMNFVKGVHQEGQLKRLTPEQLVLQFKNELQVAGREGIFKFLESKK